jgi:geranylgeranyl diphosphate synthase, type II
MISAPQFLIDRQRALASELDRVVPPVDREPASVHRAIRYTLLGPSKRARGVLTLLAADLFTTGRNALPAAAAIELIHASSLILDDLPAMDDTPIRRGRPSNHVEFGEATSILAAVALLNLAFGHLAAVYDPPLASALARVLSDAIGSEGLIGGQAADLQLPARPLHLDDLEPVHHRKTAVLFRAAAVTGALVGGASQSDTDSLAAFGDEIGLAFQIVDDVLDVEQDGIEEPARAPREGHRPHVAWIADPATGKRRAHELAAQSVAMLERFGARAEWLRELARLLVERTE